MGLFHDAASLEADAACQRSLRERQVPMSYPAMAVEHGIGPG